MISGPESTVIYNNIVSNDVYNNIESTIQPDYLTIDEMMVY